jgi:hypothetical protein
MLLETESKDGQAAIRLIAINPSLRRQAEELLPAMERAKQGAARHEIREILIRMAPIYAIEDRTENEWDYLLEAYLGALDGFSVYQIEDAFRRWNRGEDMKDPAMGQFYPKPAQLVALANKAKSEVWTASYRARKALEHIEAQPPKVPAEERAQVADGFKALAESFRLKQVPDDLRPRLSPQEVAARLRGEGTSIAEDIVL